MIELVTYLHRIIRIILRGAGEGVAATTALVLLQKTRHLGQLKSEGKRTHLFDC